MTTPRVIPHPGHVEDDELERLALSWGSQALEVERRRRLRARQLAQLPPKPVLPQQPWRKFWAPTAEEGRHPMWPA